MKLIRESGEEYLKNLQEKSETSRVHHRHQFVGLQLAEILNDPEHKSLYIKLAKTQDREKLLRLAKTVAENPKIKNRGAYFMKLLHQ